MKSICILIILTIIFCSPNYAQIFNCDSTIRKDVIHSFDWNQLDASYQIIAKDTLIGKKQVLVSHRLIKDDKLIAFGKLNNRSNPDGNWVVLDKKGNNFAIWGEFKNGKKKDKWFGYDGFYFSYKPKHKNLVFHNHWVD